MELENITSSDEEIVVSFGPYLITNKRLIVEENDGFSDLLLSKIEATKYRVEDYYDKRYIAAGVLLFSLTILVILVIVGSELGLFAGGILGLIPLLMFANLGKKSKNHLQLRTVSGNEKYMKLENPQEAIRMIIALRKHT